MTTKADKAAQRIADQAERGQVQKVERSQLGEQIVQIATSLGTDAGSLIERKIMACKLLDIEYNLNVSQWCLEAGIGRGSWYSAHNNSDFGDRCVKVANKIFGPVALEITRALIHKARFGGSDGMGDTAAQLAVARQCGTIDKVQAGNAVQQTVTVIVQQEREDRLERGLGRLGFNRVKVRD